MMKDNTNNTEKESIPKSFNISMTEQMLTQDNITAILMDGNDDVLTALGTITVSNLNHLNYKYECFTIDMYNIDTIKLLLSYMISEFQKGYSKVPTNFEVLQMNIAIIYNFESIQKECFDKLNYDTIQNLNKSK